MEYMCFNREGAISTQNGSPLKLVDKFKYHGSSGSSTEQDVNTRLAKMWTAIDRLSIRRKSDQSDKIKQDFFQAVAVSILHYGCTSVTLTKPIDNRLNVNCTRIVQVILNKSWKYHRTKQHLFGHLSSISKTILVRRIRHAGSW